ncbi:MAG: M55 family metallopeptidase [Candidatus Hodarchaeota archaeon]
MRAFISTDLEGLPYVVSFEHTNLKGRLYKEARRIATKITLIVAEELNMNGFKEILVADSHGPKVNILIDDLPEYIEIIRGSPRPVSMVAGIKGCDAALFLGYHAKFGTLRSTFDHTYSGGIINQLLVNGIAMSEFLLNTHVAGHFNVPVILVAGDAQLIADDVTQYTPWAETVALKESLSKFSAKSASMIKIEKELREAVKRAVTKFKENKTRPLIMEPPIRTEITFLHTHFADVADLLPEVTRINALKVEYTTTTAIDTYKIFQLLTIAAAGVSSYFSDI